VTHIELDGLITAVSACRGTTLLGEDVMKRYRRVIDRSQNPVHTFTRLGGETDDA